MSQWLHQKTKPGYDWLKMGCCSLGNWYCSFHRQVFQASKTNACSESCFVLCTPYCKTKIAVKMEVLGVLALNPISASEMLWTPPSDVTSPWTLTSHSSSALSSKVRAWGGIKAPRPLARRGSRPCLFWICSRSCPSWHQPEINVTENKMLPI